MAERQILSDRALGVVDSVTLAISAAAKKAKAEGKDVISFAAGEPDYKTPAHICEAAIKAIHDGLHGYTDNAGLPALREAVCEKFLRDNKLEYKPAQTLVSPGAKFNLYLAMQAMVNPGDEVIIPTPAWVSYPDIVKLAGGVPVELKCREEDGFSFGAEQLKAAITPRTKLLILNSPSNPTGGIIPPKDIRAIAEVLESKGIWCISDEIYEKLIYGDAEHLSIAATSKYAFEHTVIIHGVSKTYAMTGWRIGYAVGPLEVIKAMARIQSQSTSNACSIAQAASIAALRGPQDCVTEMVKEFAARRDLIVKGLNSIPGVRCPEPKGAFYAFPNVAAHIGKSYGGKTATDDIQFCNLALENALIAPVPGGPFGAPGHIRLSYACSRDNINKGVDRLRKMVAG